MTHIELRTRDYDWDYLVQEDRVHGLLYTDPAIFEAEMTHIFGGTWVYLAHESQIPERNDFITAKLGLRPLILLRDNEGKIRALFNRCTHRGTTLCRLEKGNSARSSAPITAGISTTTASCAACRGRTAMPAILHRTRNSTWRRCRASNLSRLHLRHAQSGARRR